MAIVDRAAPSPPLGRAALRLGAGSPVAAPVAAAPRDRVRDLIALGLLAGCAFLVVALATFDPADPPAARVFPPHARATNACGLFGSSIATAVYEACGLGGWFVVALLLGFDIALLRRRPMPDLPLRAAGAVLAAGGVCTLLAMFLPAWIDRPLWGPGGRVGALGRCFAEAYLARAGAAIVVSAVTAAGLFLACDALLLRLAGGLAVGDDRLGRAPGRGCEAGSR
jgi:S-DNA-T family DNA segregation ATPase FtsK/SpoIIIE